MEPDVTIRDVMTREYVGVSESDTVRGAAQLMHDDEVGSAVVLRGVDAVGIITEYDVLGLVAEARDPDDTAVSEVMSSPVVTIDPDLGLADAAGVMTKQGIRNLIVEPDGPGREDEEPLGVLTERDVIAATAARGPTTASEFDPAVPREEADLAGPSGVTDADTERAVAPNGGFEQRGICEVCGTLTESLHESNGQLVCSDCLEV